MRLLFTALLSVLLAAPVCAFEGNAGAFPAKAPFDAYGLVYIGNLNQQVFTGLPSAYTIALLRIPARTLWTACNGNSGDYTWTSLANALSSATGAGLKIIIDVELGANSPDCELFTRLSGSGASYTTKWGFPIVIPQNGNGVVPGSNVTVPVPWNPIFKSDAATFFGAMATEVYTTLGYTQSQIVGINDTIATYNDDESSLPNATGGNITCTGAGSGQAATGTCTTTGIGCNYESPSNQQCTGVCGSNTCSATGKQDNTGAGSWDVSPYSYTRTLLANAVAAFDLVLEADFPGAVIHHDILRNRFPEIDANGTYTGVQDGVLTPSLIAQTTAPGLTNGLCEFQVNNMGYSNGTGSPNMVDVANTVAGTNCWIGFQSNGSGVNSTNTTFSEAYGSALQYGPRQLQWYSTEFSSQIAANPAMIARMTHYLNSPERSH